VDATKWSTATHHDRVLKYDPALKYARSVALLVEKWVNLCGKNEFEGARMNLVKFDDDLRRQDI
jgi:hypothetical protein